MAQKTNILTDSDPRFLQSSTQFDTSDWIVLDDQAHGHGSCHAWLLSPSE